MLHASISRLGTGVTGRRSAAYWMISTLDTSAVTEICRRMQLRARSSFRCPLQKRACRHLLEAAQHKAGPEERVGKAAADRQGVSQQARHAENMVSDCPPEGPHQHHAGRDRKGSLQGADAVPPLGD